jgi:signal peptide peptidase SppA
MQIELIAAHMDLLSRPLWAVTTESFAALMQEIASRNFFKAQAFALLKPTTLGKVPANKVTVIPVQGVLTKDCAWCGTTYGSIASAAEEAAADPSVKRIVLSVDSPGGEITGLPETAAVLSRVAKVKPVSAVVEGMAASAAYWLASQASDITLTPSGEVGSVGVRMMHVDVTKAMEDAGIKVTELSAGKYKTEWSPFQPLSEHAAADMQVRLDAAHKDFLTAVGQGRGSRARSDIRAKQFGGGRMFSAKDALAHGLVDAVQAPREFFLGITPGTEESNAPSNLKRARLQLERAKF